MLAFKLPKVQGTLPSKENIVYFSCDENYYNEYGIALIKSIIYQIDWIHVHCHIISKNPVTFLKEFPRTTYTYEIIDEKFVNTIPFEKLFSVSKVDTEINPEIVYFSCARFMQLNKIFDHTHRVFQIDCDSLLFKTFTIEDFKWLTDTPKPMRKTKSPQKIIASAISFGSGSTGQDFRNLLSETLYERFSQQAYWFIDQIALQEIFNQYNYESIPLHWNTWNKFHKIAFFQTAKGNKKDNYKKFIDAKNYWLNY